MPLVSQFIVSWGLWSSIVFWGVPSGSAAFVLFGTPKHAAYDRRLFLSSSAETPPAAAQMRLKDIQAELRDLDADYKDCFDKESLVQRLIQARQEKSQTSESVDDDRSSSASDDDSANTEAASNTESSPSTPSQTSSSLFDRDLSLQELRSKRVSELRQECSTRKIRWANFVEKEDMVRAIADHMELASDFSVNITPGHVADLSGTQLEEEFSTPHTTPLLLDIYATWCGPCQMFAGELKGAAEEFQSRVRVGKLDSDQNPDWASRLGAAGLPTVVLFDANGTEVRRIEGAMRKEQVIEFVESVI